MYRDEVYLKIMSITIKGVAQRTLATLTMATTVLGLAGFAALTPVTALAVAPADYGLHEGDTISASGSNDPDIYIVNDWGYKRLFVNPAIFTLYGHLSWAGVKAVSPATRDAFGTSGLFRNCETGDQKVYGLDVISEDVANLRWINTSGAQAVLDDPQFFLKVFCINTNEQNLYGVGADYTSVLQVPVYTRGGGTSSTPTPMPTAGFNPNGGTQGSIDALTLGSPAKSEALEGESNVEIYAVDADLSADGPLLMQSADIWFSNSDSTSSLKPWDYFTSVRLMVGGATVATVDADAISDWSDASNTHIGTAGTTQEYRIRFTNLNGVLVSDATTEISVAVSMGGVIDSMDDSAVWNTKLGDIRILDESDLVVTRAGDLAATTTLDDSFTTGTADVAALQARDAVNEVEASVFEVSETVDTNGVAIYKFTIEETNGVAVDIDALVLNFQAFSSASVGLLENDVIARARIKEGSTQRGSDETVSSIGSASFDNLNIHLNGDQKKEFTIEVDLRDNAGGTAAANRYDEGATISVSVDDDSFVFVDANGNDEGDINEDVVAVSNTHSLRSRGVQLTLVSTSISKSVGASGASDVATAIIKFDVKAFGGDAYIDLTALASASSETATQYTQTGAQFGSGVITTTGAANGTNGYLVSDDQTRQFTVTVAMTTSSTGGVFADAALTNLLYALTDVDGDLHYTFDLAAYKTDLIFIKKN